MSLKKSNGYIQVFLDGGLNQQKMGVGYVTIKEVEVYISKFHNGMIKDYPFGLVWFCNLFL